MNLVKTTVLLERLQMSEPVSLYTWSAKLCIQGVVLLYQKLMPKNFSHCYMLYILDLLSDEICGGSYLLVTLSGNTVQEEKNSLTEITPPNNVLFDNV